MARLPGCVKIGAQVKADLYGSQNQVLCAKLEILGFAINWAPKSEARNPKFEMVRPAHQPEQSRRTILNDQNCPRCGWTPQLQSAPRFQMTKIKERWVSFICLCFGHWNIRYLNLFRIWTCPPKPTGPSEHGIFALVIRGVS